MKSTKSVIFLDIDGVLNDTPCCPRGPRILPEQAERFDELVRASGAEVVLASAWRKWTTDGSMSEVGFERLLYTHGIDAKIAGVLPDNIEIGQASPGAVRAVMIQDYVQNHDIVRFVVLDDWPLNVKNFVHVDGHKGLTCGDVVRAYKILRDQ